MSTIDKYRQVHQEQIKTEEHEIRVTAKGYVSNYITYAAKLFHEKKLEKCIIKGSGPAISKVCTIAEILRQRIKGLHEENKITSINIVDVYEPLEEGLDIVKQSKSLTVFEVILSLNENEVNKSSPGYQEPLPEDQVKEFSINFGQEREGGRRGRGGRRGGFRGGRRGRRGQRRGGYRGERKNYDNNDQDYQRNRPKTADDDGYFRQQRRGDRRGGDRRKYSGRNYERQERQDRPDRQRNDNRYDNRQNNRQERRGTRGSRRGGE